MSLALVLVCIEQNSFNSVSNNVAKIRNHLRTEEEIAAHQPKICVATGLTHLSHNLYLEAVCAFISTLNTLGNTYTSVVTMNDVAICGGLCALASMDWKMLKEEVLNNTMFRNFLKLELHIC